jgi:hypothetical protein
MNRNLSPSAGSQAHAAKRPGSPLEGGASWRHSGAVGRNSRASAWQNPGSQLATRSGLERGEAVTGRELQNVLFFVLALYASIALTNWGSELSLLSNYWHAWTQFLSLGTFGG